jgi:hypothetical protein
MPTILCQHPSRHKQETTALSIFPSTKICRKKPHYTLISVALLLGQRSFCMSQDGNAHMFESIDDFLYIELGIESRTAP